ncbi:hypothetical protein GCM10022243_30710 [Saccharothrix violaceirubra]|uniref:Uncharacterized protein n=1 Tax=Saccharothrix violaceirubra TaxID=413306 RepID=A0A7W7T532_9PSEU|nr:hypothetical protein [Saccharothrix violaceirubra]MBB4966697.1 hypothetical protein [Saccharothrix violaceirubra]
MGALLLLLLSTGTASASYGLVGPFPSREACREALLGYLEAGWSAGGCGYVDEPGTHRDGYYFRTYAPPP